MWGETKMMHNISLKMTAADVEDKRLIVLNSSEWMQRNWVIGQYYEIKMLDYIKENYKGGTFIDVGACMGNHSIFFSDVADKVVSFEPVQENYYHLTLNLKLNEIKNVDSYNLGLSNKNDLVSIWYDDKYFSNGSSTITGKTEKMHVEKLIPVITMDSFKIEDVKLIKIDVEGYNIPVLEGGIETIKKFKPDMFIECATDEEYIEVFDFLKPLGYLEPKKVFDGTPTFLFSVKELVVKQ